MESESLDTYQFSPVPINITHSVCMRFQINSYLISSWYLRVIKLNSVCSFHSKSDFMPTEEQFQDWVGLKHHNALKYLRVCYVFFSTVQSSEHCALYTQTFQLFFFVFLAKKVHLRIDLYNIIQSNEIYWPQKQCPFIEHMFFSFNLILFQRAVNNLL